MSLEKTRRRLLRHAFKDYSIYTSKLPGYSCSLVLATVLTPREDHIREIFLLGMWNLRNFSIAALIKKSIIRSTIRGDDAVSVEFCFITSAPAFYSYN